MDKWSCFPLQKLIFVGQDEGASTNQSVRVHVVCPQCSSGLEHEDY